MFFPWFKRKKVDRHLSTMAAALLKRYGRHSDCTQGQVSATLKALDTKPYLRPYSYAVFLSRKAALRHFNGVGRYEQRLKEIADLLFEGDLSEVGKFQKPRKVGNSGHSSYGIITEASGANNQNF